MRWNDELNVDFGELKTRDEDLLALVEDAERLASRVLRFTMVWFVIGIAYGFFLGVIVVSSTINSILK